MNWLAQNWLWIVAIVVAACLVVGNRHLGWRGFRQHGYPGSSGAGHGSHGIDEGGSAPAQPPGQAASATDPVTRKQVSTAAFTSVYEGRIYYFETAESRQRFETSPEQYAHKELGHSLGPVGGSAEPRRPRRRGGCC